MSFNYNFNELLSPLDFEILSAELLQKHFSTCFETFPPGRDGGIDLRSSKIGNKYIYVQCKNYKKINDLKSKLKEEVSKIDKFKHKSDDYILVTALDLTSKQKEEIIQILSPHLVLPENIFSRSNLNSLLSLYPEIEKATHKLWLSSIDILQSIINNKAIHYSKMEKTYIVDSMKIFVKNSSYEKAFKILKEQKSIIISGAPGIGKTTLARAMIFHIMRGYSCINQSADLVVLKENISEAHDQYNEDKPQIFYFDDFLGSNFLQDRLNRNEDREIIRFMDHIKAKNNKWFIMTTREHLLNQAKIHYEQFDHHSIELSKLILDVGAYTNKVKAQILYNHMYFAKNLSKEHLNEILKDNRYLKIIKHRNYSPRLIQYLTLDLNVNNITSSEYFDYIIDMIEHPLRIWEKAYETQLSENGKKMLITIATFESFLDYKMLCKAIPNLKNNELKQSLKELDGVFINLDKLHGNSLWITFHSPSVKDFLISYLTNNLDLVIEVLNKAISVEQFFSILSWRSFGDTSSNKVIINSSHKDQITKLLLKSAKELFVDYDDNQKCKALYKIASNIDEPNPELNTFVNDHFNSINPKNLSEFGYEYYINIYVLYFESMSSLNLNWFFKVISETNSIKKFIAFSELSFIFDDFEIFTHTDEFAQSLSGAVYSEVSYAKEEVHENEYLDSVIDDIELIEARYEIEFHDEVKQIKEVIFNKDSSNTDEVLDSDTISQKDVSDSEIIGMFRSLVELNC